MGTRILQAPDGTWAIFSTITDTIVLYDASPEEVAQDFAVHAANEARRRALSEIDRARSLGLAETQERWEEALASDAAHGGDVGSRYSRRAGREAAEDQGWQPPWAGARPASGS